MHSLTSSMYIFKLDIFIYFQRSYIFIGIFRALTRKGQNFCTDFCVCVIRTLRTSLATPTNILDENLVYWEEFRVTLSHSFGAFEPRQHSIILRTLRKECIILNKNPENYNYFRVFLPFRNPVDFPPKMHIFVGVAQVRTFKVLVNS